jgi:hypothetical protein
MRVCDTSVRMRPRTVKTHPWGKHGRGQTSGRCLWTSGRNGRPDGNFYRRTSVMTTLSMYGCASSMEDECSEGGEEYESCEEDKFWGWPLELLLILQHRWGLHQKKKQVQGEYSARGQKVQQCGEGRGWGYARRNLDTDTAATLEGIRTLWGSGSGGEGAGLGGQWARAKEGGVGLGGQWPPEKGNRVDLGEVGQ